jgi:ribonuclease J
MDNMNLKEKSLENQDRVHVMAVGGCGEFGMNMTAYAYRGHCVIIDCGLVFAEPYEIGIDAHIPSPSALVDILGGIPDAFLITHGHEDHLGALPLFLPHWDIPVYLGPWALELLKEKLLQRNDTYGYQLHLVHNGAKISINGLFQIDWVHVPHSIPYCSSLLITAGSIRVFHTGDFKTKGYLPYDADIDLSHISRLLKEGPIHLLVSDSTNAQSEGFCPSESSTFEPLKNLIQKSEGITFITTFSSNLWRINTILRAVKHLQKRALVFGAGMRKALDLGSKLNLLEDNGSVIMDEQELQKTERKNIVVIISGCQGEYRSGMFRLVADEINFMDLREGDQCIFSSRTIPGNEKSIAKIVSQCHERGATVYTNKDSPGIHVSGHAHAEDLLLLLKTLKPKFYMPVHGTFTQITANQSLATEPEVIPIANGKVISLNAKEWKEIADFNIPRLFIDSWSRQAMDFETMRSRHKIGDSGLAIASGFMGLKRYEIEMDFIGLPFQGESDVSKVKELLVKKIVSLYEQSVQNSSVDKDIFNEQARQLIRKHLTDRFIKKPVVISRISIGTLI